MGMESLACDLNQTIFVPTPVGYPLKQESGHELNLLKLAARL